MLTNLSETQKKTYDIIDKSKLNVFIQGQAGTGKSTFINYIKNNCKKDILFLSPTSLAALNIRGATLHSTFRLPPSDFITDEELLKAYKVNSHNSVLKSVDMIIIDEISMVRPDILDAIDFILRKVRKNTNKCFGGVQCILIGDIYQLPPVINANVKEIFKDIYDTDEPYFFDAISYKEGDFINIEFEQVFRQEDNTLLDNLTSIRLNNFNDSQIAYFNTCKFTDEETKQSAITITPYRQIASKLNEEKLKNLPGKEITYEAIKEGNFKNANQSHFPAPDKLKLKEGALVMFNKNSDYWVNGTMGKITALSKTSIRVKLINGKNEVHVTPEKWESFKYTYDTTTKEIKKENIGTYTQFPLQLGYALTIHSCQGKTLDKVNIDMSRGAFAHGQLYVALSRTRKKEDINIITPIKTKDVIISKRIIEFMQNIK